MPFSVRDVKQLLESFRYAYPSARAKAMKSLLLSEAQLDKVLEAHSLQEAAESLRETPYGPLLTDKRDILDIEGALNTNLAQTLTKISQILPGDAQKVFNRYLTRHEAENIRSVFVGIKAGLPPKKILEMVVPLYVHLEKDHYEKMEASKTIEEAIAALVDTPYHPPLTQALKEYERTRLLLTLDAAVDQMIYHGIFELIRTSRGSDVGSLKKMIGIEIDIKNMLSIIRLRNSRATPKDVMKYIIPRGYGLHHNDLEELSKAADTEELISRLPRKYYQEALARVFQQTTSDKTEAGIDRLEQALEHLWIDVGRAFERDYPLGIGPVLGYVMAKTREVGRLKGILKLIDEGFTRDEIIEVIGEL